MPHYLADIILLESIGEWVRRQTDPLLTRGVIVLKCAHCPTEPTHALGTGPHGKTVLVCDEHLKERVVE